MYVLEELWQLVQSLPLDANVALVDYTKKRLAHRSPVVKQKVRSMQIYWHCAHLKYKERLAPCYQRLLSHADHLSQTLRVIKHICSKGSSDFKRSFQKQAAPVR